MTPERTVLDHAQNRGEQHIHLMTKLRSTLRSRDHPTKIPVQIPHSAGESLLTRTQISGGSVSQVPPKIILPGAHHLKHLISQINRRRRRRTLTRTRHPHRISRRRSTQIHQPRKRHIPHRQRPKSGTHHQRTLHTPHRLTQHHRSGPPITPTRARHRHHASTGVTSTDTRSVPRNIPLGNAHGTLPSKQGTSTPTTNQQHVYIPKIKTQKRRGWRLEKSAQIGRFQTVIVHDRHAPKIGHMVQNGSLNEPHNARYAVPKVGGYARGRRSRSRSPDQGVCLNHSQPGAGSPPAGNNHGSKESGPCGPYMAWS